MSNRNTPHAKVRFCDENRDQTPKTKASAVINRAAAASGSSSSRKPSISSVSDTPENVFNTGFSSSAASSAAKKTPLSQFMKSSSLNSPTCSSNSSSRTGLSTPKIATKLSSSTRSIPSLCSTPISNSKSSAITPKSNLKPRQFSSTTELQKTPECFSKVSLETPKRVSAKQRQHYFNDDLNMDDTVKSKDGEMSNLTVAVRVRPMNSKELMKPAISNVVQVEGNEVIVSTGSTADNLAGVIHRFQYDNAYWSCNIDHANYSSQELVFKGTALPLVEKAFEGYNACLFAYGQTGSGKSYSMMGIDLDDHDQIGPNSESGIIPRFCQELFRRIDDLKGKYEAEVEVSYFEIYNEKIHDLLAVSIQDGLVNSATNHNKRTALRVREHPIWGPYVVDLSTHPVDSHTAIRNWLAVGNSQRATAATGMNDKSSRSHSIFNIVLNLSEINPANVDGPSQTKRSKISLVDLAGSERVHTSHTCASGDRMREGVSINKSLLTLGKVIAALADSKRGGSFVPYRESVLTWLLRENLGGNSRTVMLATISPASIHLDETLATLRYACQARTIVNRVKVNEDPQDRIIRELRAEVDRLQALRHEYERQKRLSASSPPPPRKIIIETSADENEIEALRQQLIEAEFELTRAERSWMDRLKEAENIRKTELRLLKQKGLALELSAEQKQPCLVNLAADPGLSGTLLYLIPTGVVKIGRSRPSVFEQPDIVLEGPLVAFHHCSIQNTNGKLTLIPQVNDTFETFVNGELASNTRQLLDGDRLVIGGSHYFRVANPHCPNRGRNMVVDFQTAYQEILNEQEKRLREELDREKHTALLEIEHERQENEKIYNEKMERLELEKFKYTCSKEQLETEKNAFAEKNMRNKKQLDLKPYQSTVIDDIARMLKDKTKDNLHKIQMLVKEATQRCRDLGLNYEFKQSHIANEMGKFRHAIKILDHENFRSAEWPNARLEIWLDRIRESSDDVTKETIFQYIDMNWTNEDYNADESMLNESFNSSKISLNLSAMKDAILGNGGGPKAHKINTTPVQISKSSSRSLFKEPNENTPPLYRMKTVGDFDECARQYLKDMQTCVTKFKKLITTKNCNDTMKMTFVKNINDIEYAVNEMKQKLNGDGAERDTVIYNKTPIKSSRFLLD